MGKRTFSFPLSLAGMTVLGVAGGACAGVGESAEAPEADLDGVEAQQLVTTVNADGTWTGNAATPVITGSSNPYQVQGSATFTGPSGKTRKMGACTIKRAQGGPGAPTSYIACSGNDAVDPDTGYQGPCTAIPLPAGGYRYCVAPNNSGQKYCMIRPGSETAYCAGTPALGYVPVAPGTYTTPKQNIGTGQEQVWQTLGCFEGCKNPTIDPISSSAGNFFKPVGGGK